MGMDQKTQPPYCAFTPQTSFKEHIKTRPIIINVVQHMKQIQRQL